MRRVIGIPVDEVIPPVEAVLRAQGIPRDVVPDARTSDLARQSVLLYGRLADPVGLLREVSEADFEAVYRGEALNAEHTPLEDIYRSADSLALFAVTVGQDICAEISRLFDEREFALGSMLDSAASEGTEMASEVMRLEYHEQLEATARLETTAGVMQFSPGYCGWHVSAQRKLFQALSPEEIGIELSDSFLMQPLKSVTGVIVAGPGHIFEFDDKFPFCRDCETHSCRQRARAIQRN
ncbi:MAG TPA: vitamin B12 dependent-methionine synthase activation domain-containing protein [Acidobacteriota bacterium]|nr:vitamin B12 dependent-methionine synthase activation domain-containing protein [Acidobacteriota bacterium]